jgi:hypothetical protein
VTEPFPGEAAGQLRDALAERRVGETRLVLHDGLGVGLRSAA